MTRGARLRGVLGTEAPLLGVLCLVHLALGLLRAPGWIFSKYPDGARLLAQGRLGAAEAADFSPLYLLLNLALAPGQLRWLQALASCAAVFAVHRLAQDAAGRGAARLAALLAALCLPLLVAEVTLEPDQLIAALSLGALALWGAGVSGRSARGSMLTGLLLGAAAALRPTGLLLLVGVAALHALGARRERALLGRSALLLAVGGLVSVLPTLWLRHSVGAQAGATMSVGAVLHHGNRPEGTGIGAQPPHLLKQLEAQLRSADRPDPVHGLYRRFAQAAVRESLDPAAAERFWVRKTLAFVTHEPGAFTALLGRKLLALLLGPEAYDVAGSRGVEAQLWPLPAAPPLAALGLLGLLLLLLRRRPMAPLLLYLAYSAGLSLLFYVSSRYRLGLVLVWAVLGGVTLEVALQALRQRALRPLLHVALGSAVALLLLLLSLRLTSTRVFARGQEANRLLQAAAAERSAGRWDAAVQGFFAARAAQPFLSELWDVRGLPAEDPEGLRESARLALEHYDLDRDLDAFFALSLVAETGNCAAALPQLQALSERGLRWAINDWSLDPALTASRCLLRQGQRAAALQEVRRSLAARPATLDALAAALAAAEALPSETAADVQHWRETLGAVHDPLSAGYALARAHLDWGNPASALREADGVLVHLPEAALVHHVRAEALVALGQGAQALAAYDRALTLFPGHAFTTRPFDAPLAAALAAMPADPALLALAADHALRQGLRQEARARANRARDAAGAQLSPELLARLRTVMALSR